MPTVTTSSSPTMSFGSTSPGLSPYSTIRPNNKPVKETMPQWLRSVVERAPQPPKPASAAVAGGEGRERDLIKLVQEQQKRLEVLEAENASLRSKVVGELRVPQASEHHHDEGEVSREQLWLLIDDLVEQRRVSEESHHDETKALRGAIAFFLKEREREDTTEEHTPDPDESRLIADARHHVVESDDSSSSDELNHSGNTSHPDEESSDSEDNSSEADTRPQERSSHNLLKHYRSALLKESRTRVPLNTMSVSPEASHHLGTSPGQSTRVSHLPERDASLEDVTEPDIDPHVLEVPINPNQRGIVVGDADKNNIYLLVEALKCGIVYEVCKSFREREAEEVELAERLAEEEAARRGAQFNVGTEQGRIGRLKATVGTLAAGGRDALRSTAFNMVNGKHKHMKQRANEQLIGETSEYFCHWEHNKVVCQRNLPTSLPPLKAHNTDASILQNFNPDKDRGIVGSWDSTRLLDARTDQLRLQFLGPRFFAVMREFLGVDLGKLRQSAEQCQWRHSQSAGKSAATLIYFGDFVLKEVKQDIEMRFLKDHFLAPYMAYVRSHPATLLPHFLSVVSITNLHSRTTTTFILMRNVLSTPHPVSTVYDLKGSVVGRTGVSSDETPSANFSDVAPLLKDNDLPADPVVFCGPLRRAQLLAQIQVDTSFLRRLHIVDYSLLVGIRGHNTTRSESGALQSHNQIQLPWAGIVSEPLYDPGDANTFREEEYFLGFIDVLQPYNSGKQIENFAKGLVQDKHGISIVPPDEFADRLCKLAGRIFD